MLGRDQIYVFGGWQRGDGFAPSNHVNLIDFQDTSKPKVSRVGYMNFPRSDANATILPNGDVFINGGHRLNDLEFSVLEPEIFSRKNNSFSTMSPAKFRRNYHATSLLLPNGTVLVAGGDIWNAEVFYPPYLFTKNKKSETVLAKRPVIDLRTEKPNRGEAVVFSDSADTIAELTIISGGSTTHAQGSEPKFLNLKIISRDSKKIIFEIPENRNLLQNGFYMIFGVTHDGVPSEGALITLS